MENSNKQEFVELVVKHQGILRKICNIYCHIEEERKDLSQEILIQLWKSYPSFRGDSKFTSWMYRVALNVALQHIRKFKNKPINAELPTEFNHLAESSVDIDNKEENLQLLHHAIQQLNDIEKAIIILHLEEKNNEEIAEIIGITQNYVRVKMNRIKVKLKKTVKARSHGN